MEAESVLTLEWSRPPLSNRPKLKNHSSVVLDKKIYIFGGYNGNSNNNELLVLSLESLSLSQCMKCSGSPPDPRNGHTATIVGRKMYVIGGWLGGGTIAANDVHVLDFDTMHWTARTSNSRAPPCNMHTADYIPSLNQILVFRGGDGQQYLNDLQAYDTIRDVWSKVVYRGRAPSPRANHASAVLHNKLFIFGGWNGSERLNDLHMLDIDTMTWSKPVIEGTLRPPPRAGVSLTAIANKLYLFGGSGAGSKVFDDLYVLHVHFRRDSCAVVEYELFQSESTHVMLRDVLARQQCQSVPGPHPCRRSGHTAVALRDGRLVIIGGFAGPEYVRDVAVLDTDRPPPVSVTAESVSNVLLMNLRNTARSPAYSDITFLVEGKEVHAHKLILALANERFETMFSHGFMEAHSNVIELTHTNYEAFCSLLEYLYSGEVPDVLCLLSNDPMQQGEVVREEQLTRCINLLQLADEYLCDHLKQLCELHLYPTINEFTVEHLRDVCETFNAPQLLRRCEHYMRSNDITMPTISIDIDMMNET